MKQANKVFNGAILTVIMRWTDRLIGLISTIILARLLVPEDFGIIAMASLVVGFVDILLALGVNQALIHNQKPDLEDYHTAWTIRLIQSFLTSSILFFSAPVAAIYFNNDNITDVLHVMAIGIIIGSLENIGIVDFQKKMQFNLDFKFFFGKRIISFITTLLIAYYLHSYWALVFGSLAGRIYGVIISYIMHKMRPKISLSRLKEILSFSQWILFKNIGVYFDTKMDSLLVGRFLDSKALGGYTLAGEISSLPTTELLSPLGRVLFPAFVEKRNDPKAFEARFQLALGVQCLVAIPACLGLIFITHDLVYLMLGEKWLFIAPVIQIMAISSLVGTLSHSGGYALLALGKVKLQALIIWLQAILYILTALNYQDLSSARDFAIIRLIVIAIGSFILIGIILFQLQIAKPSNYITTLIRPAISGTIMFLSLDSLRPFLENILYLLTEWEPLLSSSIPIIRLTFFILSGAIIYSSSIFTLWFIVKKPEGAEAYLIKNLLLKTK